MDHVHDAEGGHQGHGMFYCNGEPVMTEGGSWIGHFLPGMVMLIWGCHWLQGTFRAYFDSRRTKSQEFRASTTYTLWRFPHCSESVCKAFLPILAVSLELYFAHKGGWRTLVCPAGTERAGHFYGSHMGNWQHAAMYPAFILAGFVDLIGYEVELPKGTQQVFLFFAFLCEALLMGLHKKHLPLDTAVHSILFGVMLANAAFILAELVFPAHFLVSCGRVASTLVQAGWFFMATHMIFDGNPAWDEMGGSDMGPSMFAPVMLVMIIVAVLGGMMMAFLAFSLVYKILDARGHGVAYERAGLLDDSAEANGGSGGARGAGAVALAPLGRRDSCQV